MPQIVGELLQALSSGSALLILRTGIDLAQAPFGRGFQVCDFGRVRFGLAEGFAHSLDPLFRAVSRAGPVCRPRCPGEERSDAAIP